MANKKNGIIKEFKDFISRGNVMNLAVGVIIGGAFQAIVNSLVKDVISPLIGAIGGMDFSEYAIVLRPEVTEEVDGVATVIKEAVTLNYGSFINAVINFFLMAIVIFFLVKAVNLLVEGTKRKKKVEEETPAAPTTKICPFCKSEIAIEATRCAHCTSELPAEGAQ